MYKYFVYLSVLWELRYMLRIYLNIEYVYWINIIPKFGEI